MPTYEYRCEKCGDKFEVFQSFKDRALRRHDECGGPVEKVFHPRGVVFKGSGWYATDSRSKNGSDSTSSSDGGESAPAKPKPAISEESTSSAKEPSSKSS